MRTIIINVLFVMVFSAVTICIASDQGYYTSQPQDDLCVMVTGIAKLTQPGRKSSDVPRSAEMLLFGLHTLTNADVVIAWPKQPEYMCLPELLDAAGNAIPRTRTGKLYGSKYSEVDFAKARLVRQHIGPASEPCWNLFRPADLFHIPKAGTYTLRLQFQVMKVDASKSTNAVQIVKFRSFSLPIVLEPE
jgi:hypothetical protein